MNDIIERIETIPETELERIFQHIMHKIDAFAELLRLDKHSRDFLKRVLRSALMLYIVMEEKKGGLREAGDLQACMSTLQQINSANLNKVEETLYLARDISQEYILLPVLKSVNGYNAYAIGIYHTSFF